MRTVLFVCTGNTCRSPMAEAWLKALCGKDARTDIRAASAGMNACPGEPASPHAREVVRAAGGNLSHHAARQLNEQMVREAEMIAVMSPSHLHALRRLTPEAEARTFLLSRFSTRNPESAIPDPFGGSLEEYQNCFRTIREAVENLYFSLTEETK